MINYSDATKITDDGQLDVLNSKYVNMSFLPAPTFKKITVTQSNVANLVGIAKGLYGNHDYWRALMWYNGITDPINEVVTGVTLEAPSRFALDAFLKEHVSIKPGMQCLIK